MKSPIIEQDGNYIMEDFKNPVTGNECVRVCFKSRPIKLITYNFIKRDPTQRKPPLTVESREHAIEHARQAIRFHKFKQSHK